MPEFEFLRDLMVILVAALGVVIVLHRLRVPSLAGFVVAGVLIGPHAAGLVRDIHEVELLAEVGVVLLMFGIGMELSLERIRRLWKAILLGGSVQVVTMILLVTAVAVGKGWATSHAVFLGCVLAISSTAVVLRGFTSRGELDTPHGRLGLGILVFQDLSVVPMMLAIPLLAGQGETSDAIASLAKAVGLLALVLIASRFVVPSLLATVARTRQRDLFSMTVLLICIGTAYLAAKAGVSLALGAFLGGMVVAGSEYRHQALSDLIPVRDVLSGVFFISIGMLLDMRQVAERADDIALLLTVVLVAKFLVGALAAGVMRLPLRVCVLTGAALCQVGEFSFILLRSADGYDLIPEPFAETLMVTIILSMAITPFILSLSPHLASGVGKVTFLDRALQVRSPEEVAKEHQLRDHVIVAGYGIAGSEAAEALVESGQAFIVVDLNPANVRRATAEGRLACYGDVTNEEVLHGLGIERARRLIIVVNDNAAVERSIRTARRLSPQVDILVRTNYAEHADGLIAAGADQVVVAEQEAAHAIRARVEDRSS